MKLSLTEWMEWTLLAARVKDDTDATLGDLLLAWGQGNDAAGRAAHDRAIELGREDLAASIRKNLEVKS